MPIFPSHCLVDTSDYCCFLTNRFLFLSSGKLRVILNGGHFSNVKAQISAKRNLGSSFICLHFSIRIIHKFRLSQPVEGDSTVIHTSMGKNYFTGHFDDFFTICHARICSKFTLSPLCVICRIDTVKSMQMVTLLGNLPNSCQGMFTTSRSAVP